MWDEDEPKPPPRRMSRGRSIRSGIAELQDYIAELRAEIASVRGGHRAQARVIRG